MKCVPLFPTLLAVPHETMIVALLVLFLGPGSAAFSPPHSSPRPQTTTALHAEKVVTVQVCGFKDCRRKGGGKRLENLINEVVQEEKLENLFSVEGCDCQGECGYGPNLVVDGNIVNDVRGREAILQALGISVMLQSSVNNGNHKLIHWAIVPNDDEREGESHSDDASTDSEQFGDDMDTGGVILEDLDWRVAKLRLEEQNTRRFLKSGPRFLPYEECRRWVQAWGRRWRTENDWNKWISLGEKRNPYIPSRPDEYYTKTGDWISWEHFLGAEEKKND